MLGIASEGDVFLHGARAADGGPLAVGEMGYGVTLEDIATWARGLSVERPGVTQRQEETGWQLRALSLPCTVKLDGHGGAAHPERGAGAGRFAGSGVSLWEDGIEEIARVEAAHRADDERFWERAPQLVRRLARVLAARHGLRP